MTALQGLPTLFRSDTARASVTEKEVLWLGLVHRSSVQRCHSLDHRTNRLAAAPTAVAESSAAVVLSEYDQEYYREVDARDADLDAGAPSDFYQLLGLEYDADGPAIRGAYRALQRIAHPDIAGKPPSKLAGSRAFCVVLPTSPGATAGEGANELSALLNSAYATLSNLKAKESYDAGLQRYRQENLHYDGLPEEDYGRARVMRQWGDDADAISEAIDLCPVDCIHYVPRDQLALLEFVMKSCKREDIAIVARRRSGNMGTAPSSQNPFEQAATFLRHRREARPQLRNGAMPLAQDRELAATIARAWIALPRELQRAGWPSWCEHTERVRWAR
ncbi:hypothetical protein MMC29_000912 [Sticta canariensis]|nr:hypothetical protein [Sticta canariensis]